MKWAGLLPCCSQYDPIYSSLLFMAIFCQNWVGQAVFAGYPFDIRRCSLASDNTFEMQPNEDKRLLIESMKKLSYHISSNPARQLDIFRSLALPDLTKIITNLQDTNESLRRVSALLLCELTYKNDEIKKKMAQMLGVLPAEGRICISGFSSAMQRLPSLLKDTVELMKTQLDSGEQQKMCWYINLERKNCRLEFLDYKQYSSFTFIDPVTHIFGFTLPAQPRSNANNYSPLSPVNEKYRYSQTMAIELRPKSNKLEKTYGDKGNSSWMKGDKLSDSSRHGNIQNRLEETLESARARRLQEGSYNYGIKEGIMSVRNGNKTTRHFENLNASGQMVIQNEAKIHLTPTSGRKMQDSLTERHGKETQRETNEFRPTYAVPRNKY